MSQPTIVFCVVAGLIVGVAFLSLILSFCLEYDVVKKHQGAFDLGTKILKVVLVVCFALFLAEIAGVRIQCPFFVIAP